MIRVVEKNARTYPLLICDICGERIENLGLGAAVFPRTDVDGEINDVLHVHKRSCHDAAERKVGGGKGAPWQELQDHFVYLMANAGKPVEQLVERAKTLNDFGVL